MLSRKAQDAITMLVRQREGGYITVNRFKMEMEMLADKLKSEAYWYARNEYAKICEEDENVI